MALGYICLLLLLLSTVRRRETADADAYLSKKSCEPIKGFFISLVFLSHASGYLPADDSLVGRFFFFLNDNLGQLMVAPFLFQSGYGIARSVENMAMPYIDSMPRHRILKTLAKFDIAVLCFFALNLALGIHIGPQKLLLSFIGLEAIGNSNWYIFIILLCYCFTWTSLKVASICNISSRKTNLLVWAFAIVSIVALSFFKPSYWYNTLLCFPLGLSYAVFKKKIDVCFATHFLSSITALSCVILGIHIITHFWHLPAGDLWHNIKAMAFSLLVVCLMSHVEIRSKSLTWMGKNLFEIYIYQRIPMMALSFLFPVLVERCSTVFVFLSIIFTILIVALIDTIKPLIPSSLSLYRQTK